MKKEEETALLEKYACAPNFVTPKLNPQIIAIMKEPTKARDGHMVKIQDISGLILSVTGSLMTKIYEHRDEGLDLPEILNPLKTIEDFAALSMNKQSLNRKAFVEPGLNKETVNVLKETKTDDLLYENELSVMIKESKALTKEGSVEGTATNQRQAFPGVKFQCSI